RHTRWPRDWSSDVCSSDLAFSRFNKANPIANRISYWQPFTVVAVGIFLRDTVHVPYLFTVFVALLAFFVYELRQRQLNSPYDTRSEERRVGNECRTWRYTQ